MKDKHVYAVILAGGSGTRFWPVSREAKPKQFLQIVHNRTLLDLTVDRITPLMASRNIFVVTNKRYQKETARQLKKFKIPPKNILLEPSAKNTAPAICWAAARIHRLDPRAVTLCLPSDHLILNQAKFLNIMKRAVSLARQDLLVTFGIVPTRTETGYGYLHTQPKKLGGQSVLFVKRFTEKPNRAAAKRFMRSKSYFWNSGMFVWQTRTILEEFNKLLPKVHAVLGKDPSASVVARRWQKLPKISIDYGILEKSRKVVAVKAQDLGWSDVGSWESLIETLPSDKHGNIFLGDCLAIDVKDSLAYGHERTIALIGIKDCIVVDTKDALLVCKKDSSQKVKEIVEFLIKRNSRLI